MDPVVVDSNVIIAQMTLVEGIGIAIISGVFGVVMKWQDSRHEKKRKEDNAKHEEDRKADLEYRKQREIREKARQERDAAVYGVVLSTARGTEVLLHKAHGDKLNGDVQHSLESIEKSISRYNNLANDEMAKLG